MPTSPSGACRAHRSVTAAPVAALRDVASVAEAPHQLRPCLRDAAGAPAELGRFAGEAVAGDDGITRSNASRRSRRALSDRSAARHLQQLDDRAGPAVRHDQRQRVSCLDRTWMKWMSTPSISV